MYAEKLKNAKPNLSVLKEYRKREEEFLKRAKDLEEITNLRDEQKQKYDGLRKQRLDEFMAGFSLISMKLKEMYQVRCEPIDSMTALILFIATQMITLGGNAELELVDSMDPFSEGIIFSVMPPKKSWKNISNLSGGEKVSYCKSSAGRHILISRLQTLSSLALVFALHVFKVRYPAIVTRFLLAQHDYSLRLYTSWTKSMLLLTSEMYPSSPITSKSGLKMHNLSSFPLGLYCFPSVQYKY